VLFPAVGDGATALAFDPAWRKPQGQEHAISFVRMAHLGSGWPPNGAGHGRAPRLPQLHSILHQPGTTTNIATPLVPFP
jgi:hypothetical protein